MHKEKNHKGHKHGFGAGIKRVMQRPGDMEVGQSACMGEHKSKGTFKRPNVAGTPRKA